MARHFQAILEQAPAYEGELPTQQTLAQHGRVLRSRHQETLEQVQGLLASQQALSGEVKHEVAELEAQTQKLGNLEEERQAGWSSFLRRITGRDSALLRRSITEALLKQYGEASRHLQQAGAFADELQLRSLELQEELDQLHHQRSRARRNQLRAAGRVRELEVALARLEQGEAPDGEVLPPAEQSRLRDALDFQVQLEGGNQRLLGAEVALCDSHVAPARELRNTTLQLQQQMCGFVQEARSTVEAAGQRIQALGAVADAAVVVAELNASVADLSRAMSVTSSYVAQTGALLGQALPELQARLAYEHEQEERLLAEGQQAVARERIHDEAERLLRQAADDELGALLGDT